MSESPTQTSPTGKKLVNTKSGLRMLCIVEEERSAFEVDEPKWQNDDEHRICNKCGNRFTFRTRRHHCRRCGIIFCGSCCKTKYSLPRLSFVDPQLVCDGCTPLAKKELDLYEKYLPVLLKGADLFVNEEVAIRCKLNHQTHRVLKFKNRSNEDVHEAVSLKEITSFQCLTDPLQQTAEGTAPLVGVNMKYASANEMKELKLTIKENMKTQKESRAFLLVLQRAMKMIFESN